MDAEPFRCRRTDGKKWRCRFPVLLDHKYCQRHVHRGRLCSRKPVEVHQTFIKSKSKSTASTSVSSPKTKTNLHSRDNTDLNKVNIQNQSLKIKKHPMENARRPLVLTLSAKSFLQHGDDLGREASSKDHKFGHSERCRRTDGKNWRCKKDALPGLKYCVQHMHRGVKKVENYKKSSSCLPFSVGASYQQLGGSENKSNECGSSSEATTISM